MERKIDEHLSRAIDLIEENADLSRDEEVRRALTEAQEKMNNLGEHLMHLMEIKIARAESARLEEKEQQLKKAKLQSQIDQLTEELEKADMEIDQAMKEAIEDLEREKEEKNKEFQLTDADRRPRGERKRDLVKQITEAMEALEKEWEKDDEDLINNEVHRNSFEFFQRANRQLKVRVHMKECELLQDEKMEKSEKEKLENTYKRVKELRVNTTEGFDRVEALAGQSVEGDESGALNEAVQDLERVLKERDSILSELGLTPVLMEGGPYRYPGLTKKERKELKKLQKQDAEQRRRFEKAEKKRAKEEKKAQEKKAKEEKKALRGNRTRRPFWRRCLCLC